MLAADGGGTKRQPCVCAKLNSQRELSVGGDDDLRHEVGVAGQRAVGVAVLVLPALQLPDDDALVARRGHDHVRVLWGRGAFTRGVREARRGSQRGENNGNMSILVQNPQLDLQLQQFSFLGLLLSFAPLVRAPCKRTGMVVISGVGRKKYWGAAEQLRQ